MTTLADIIKQEQATHMQVTGPDDVTLYRTADDGTPEQLTLARVGGSLRGTPDFEGRDDWFRIGSEKWEEVWEIPVNHPLWPAKPGLINMRSTKSIRSKQYSRTESGVAGIKAMPALTPFPWIRLNILST